VRQAVHPRMVLTVILMPKGFVMGGPVKNERILLFCFGYVI